MCNKIMCRTVVDLTNNNISRDVQEMCKQVVQGIYIAAIWMVENNEYLTDY